MVVLIAGGELLFHVGWMVSPGAVAAVSVAFALAVVSLGLLLATLVRTRGQAGSLTMGLALSMAALGGAWWPLEITPPLYRQFAHAFPSAWAMDAYTAILAEGASLAEVMPQIGALLGFALLFATVGVALSGRLRNG
jgi:ABC-2 type transport system permease protein